MDAEDAGGGGGDEEFEPAIDEADDETTLAAAEQEGENYEDEIAALKQEGDIPIEQLRAMYGGADLQHASGDEKDDVTRSVPAHAAVALEQEQEQGQGQGQGHGQGQEREGIGGHGDAGDEAGGGDDEENDATSLLSRSPSLAGSDSDHTADFEIGEAQLAEVEDDETTIAAAEAADAKAEAEAGTQKLVDSSEGKPRDSSLLQVKHEGLDVKQQIGASSELQELQELALMPLDELMSMYGLSAMSAPGPVGTCGGAKSGTGTARGAKGRVKGKYRTALHAAVGGKSAAVAAATAAAAPAARGLKVRKKKAPPPRVAKGPCALVEQRVKLHTQGAKLDTLPLEVAESLHADLENRLRELTGGSIELLKDPLPLPTKPQAHSDVLVAEMKWLSKDYTEERRWKEQTARKNARAVQHVLKRQQGNARRAREQRRQEIRRRAAQIGRSVKKYWRKVDKIISYKHRLQGEEAKQKAMDKHLEKLVGQTESFTKQITEAWRGNTGGDDDCAGSGDDGDVDMSEVDDDMDELASLASADVSEESGNTGDAAGDDDEFIPVMEDADDESTLAAAEQASDSSSHAAEIAALKDEGEMPIEKLRAMYGYHGEGMSSASIDSGAVSASSTSSTTRQNESDPSASVVSTGSGVSSVRSRRAAAVVSQQAIAVASGKADAVTATDDADDFVPMEDDADDESTLAAAEQEGDSSSHAAEIAALQEEGEMPIEQLRAMYAAMDQEAESEGAGDSEVVAEGDDSVADNDTQLLAGEDGEGDESINMEVDADASADFLPDENEKDDETTLAAAEQDGDGTFAGAQDEIDALKAESEMPLEELLAMHGYSMQQSEVDDDDANDDDEDTENGTQDPKDKDRGTAKRRRRVPRRASDTTSVRSALSTSSARTSASSRWVSVSSMKRPYLLWPTLRLRPYQIQGVSWLVSMFQRRLNGILADEMGLGKTVQTISLLAHLACRHGIWGPHLVVVPTSVLLNWDAEFKKFCPAFKIMTYYGSAKERKAKRQGWTDLSSFHVCITSYNLVVQDAHCFRRRKWYYLILDEAHNIKNWKSRRWETLLNFNSHRRLLLTGTPLQNSLMELWSLMHFLMPHVFRSRREFQYWFSQPLTSMVEGGSNTAQRFVTRLHSVIRPFVLRRLKTEVAKQMPKKYEHIVKVSMSKRQRNLYEEFMSRSSTRATMKGGPYIGMMNVLMQLRKCCNHPDLFEPRPIVSPFDMVYPFAHLDISVSSLVVGAHDSTDPFSCRSAAVLAAFPALHLLALERSSLDLLEQERISELQTPNAEFMQRPVLRNIAVPTTLASAATAKKATGKGMVDQKMAKVAKTLLLRHLALLHATRSHAAAELRKRNGLTNLARCTVRPVYGWRLLQACRVPRSPAMAAALRPRLSPHQCHPLEYCDALQELVLDAADQISRFMPSAERAMCYVPPARALCPQLLTPSPCSPSRQAATSRITAVLKRELAPLQAAYYSAHKRSQIFFPDRRLVQFDCGKLQTLDLLLRKLKAGKHRVLIFTQMSSMLDILEEFLSLHGHTYFRLDGATKVEDRQKLMDRFNRDEKIFCFILSTRSGGLGINLVGADSVIFYDSDWNPAMDAQAQDRAHRIGQTRDVHIYRLVTQHTVEENILLKAQQKRHLDFLVMTQGQFSAEFFSKSNLRDLVGAGSAAAGTDSDGDDTPETGGSETKDGVQSQAEVEAAMAQLEDRADADAMKLVRQEVQEDQREMADEVAAQSLQDESRAGAETPVTPVTPATQPETDPEKLLKRRADAEAKRAEKRERDEERAEEEELRRLRSSAVSITQLNAALRPVDRYAVGFRTDVDPQPIPIDADAPPEVADEELALDEIERDMVEAEEQQIASGELLTSKVVPGDTELAHGERYRKARAVRIRERKRRRLTGESWVVLTDGVSGRPFFYNEDTDEAQWDKPTVLLRVEQFERVRAEGFGALPEAILVGIMRMLIPCPDRNIARCVCSSWLVASESQTLWRHVAVVGAGVEGSSSRRHSNQLRFSSVSEALEGAHPGDTICIAPGLWRERKLVVAQRIRICALPGAEPPIIRLDEPIHWSADAGQLLGLRLCKSSGAHIRGARQSRGCVIVDRGTLQINDCELDNEGGIGPCIDVAGGSSLQLARSSITGSPSGSGVTLSHGHLLATECYISQHAFCGVFVMEGSALLRNNRIVANGQAAIRVLSSANTALNASDNDLRGNKAGAWDCGSAGASEAFSVSSNVVDVNDDPAPPICPSEPGTPRTPRPRSDTEGDANSSARGNSRSRLRRARFICSSPPHESK